MSDLLSVVRERPILFSGPMVRAILDGRKTQTRRTDALLDLIKDGQEPPKVAQFGKRWGFLGKLPDADEGSIILSPCRYGGPGTRLWVRETWATRMFSDEQEPSEERRRHYTIYRADSKTVEWDDGHYHDFGHCWRPSIFMPRWACRLVLEVVSVRVERLQGISESDATAEGVEMITSIDHGATDPRAAYKTLWDSLNAKRGHGWATNPWVWCISFKRQETAP